MCWPTYRLGLPRIPRREWHQSPTARSARVATRRPIASVRYVRVEGGARAEALFRQNRDWIVASVRQFVGWPTAMTLIEFAGHDLLLLPEENESLPAVAARRSRGHSEAELRELIARFLSSFSWEKGHGIEVVGWTGGSRPHRFGQRAVAHVATPFRLVHLPDVVEPKQRLALAFFREASALSHPGYAFLSYYKILNLRHRKGEKQCAWIRRALPRVADPEGRARLQALQEQEADVADYLYRSCRCAVAHAGVNPTVDPDNVGDQQRLRQDLPLIRALAIDCIETEFQIPTLSAAMRAHEHELAGFLDLLGETRRDAILSGLEPVDLAQYLPSSLHVGLWGAKSFPPLQGMSLQAFAVSDGVISLRYASPRRSVELAFALDLEKQRLLFDPDSGTAAADDGSADALLDAAAVQDFLGKDWANGSIEFWNAKTDECLGWCSPFVPTNIELRSTVNSFRLAAAELRTQALTRRLRGPA